MFSETDTIKKNTYSNGFQTENLMEIFSKKLTLILGDAKFNIYDFFLTWHKPQIM